MAYRLSQDEIKVTSILGRKLSTPTLDVLHPSHFAYRHIGPRRADVEEMLDLLGYSSLESFIDAVVPEEIRLRRPLALPPGRSEREVLQALRGLAGMNRVFRSYIGMGYAGCFTPQVIQRNVLENPGWYTAYTPYQAEIAQGRLEALLNFQTMVADLTGLEVANASLLDEATAAAEAMNLTPGGRAAATGDAGLSGGRPLPSADDRRGADPRRGARHSGARSAIPRRSASTPDVIGALVQYPATDGAVRDFRAVCERAHAAGALVTAATDLLALTLLTPPGEWGADVAVGNSQRFGVPLGYGGPHAAFFATRDEYKRYLPGRIIGVSKDATAARRSAWRCRRASSTSGARRRPATSAPRRCCSPSWRACTPSTTGPKGSGASPSGCTPATVLAGQRAPPAAAIASCTSDFFDTLCVEAHGWALPRLLDAARAREINLRPLSATRLGVALDETVTLGDVADLIADLRAQRGAAVHAGGHRREDASARFPTALARTSAYLDAPGLQPAPLRDRDAALHPAARGARPLAHHAMIPLGSCTMKLNATAEMMPVTWPEFDRLHPFAPRDQARATSSSSASSRTSWPRSPASRRSRCSRTPARRASTPGCW